jgi:hypothetical protein
MPIRDRVRDNYPGVHDGGAKLVAFRGYTTRGRPAADRTVAPDRKRRAGHEPSARRALVRSRRGGDPAARCAGVGVPRRGPVRVEYDLEGDVAAVETTSPAYASRSGIHVGLRLPPRLCHLVNYRCKHSWRGFSYESDYRTWERVSKAGRYLRYYVELELGARDAVRRGFPSLSSCWAGVGEGCWKTIWKAARPDVGTNRRLGLDSAARAVRSISARSRRARHWTGFSRPARSRSAPPLNGAASRPSRPSRTRTPRTPRARGPRAEPSAAVYGSGASQAAFHGRLKRLG